MLIPIPSLSQENTCPAKPENNEFQIKEEWKTKFPFDIVYPIGNPDTDIDTTCPKLTVFSVEREICSIMSISKTIKYCVLIKLVIDNFKNA